MITSAAKTVSELFVVFYSERRDVSQALKREEIYANDYADLEHLSKNI